MTKNVNIKFTYTYKDNNTNIEYTEYTCSLLIPINKNSINRFGREMIETAIKISNPDMEFTLLPGWSFKEI